MAKYSTRNDEQNILDVDVGGCKSDILQIVYMFFTASLIQSVGSKMCLK